MDVQNGLDLRFDEADGLCTVWGIDDPATTNGWGTDQLALIEHLGPNIRHFVRVRQALTGAEALGGGLAALLDNLRIGVLNLDRRGRVVAANAPALAVLRRGDGLFDEGGSLRARLAEDHTRLQEPLARVLPGPGNGDPAGGSMAVRRRSGGTPLGLRISPVGGAQGELASRRVAALLAEGNSVREIAAATGFRENYVRSLQRDIYREQGLPGQMALVLRVLALEAVSKR